VVQVTIDRGNWNAEFARLRRDFEPAVARSLRRNMREVGQETLAEMKRLALQPPPNDNPDISVGSREAIARQTKFVVNFTKRSAGVRFTTTPGKLGNFIFGYNQKAPFRHPVFGQKNVQVKQQGRPYFGAVLTQQNVDKMVSRLGNVIDDANKAIGAKF